MQVCVLGGVLTIKKIELAEHGNYISKYDLDMKTKTFLQIVQKMNQ